MKVYTEIIYTWDDNIGELVEESSKSFEYQGEVTLCDSKRYPHAHFGGTLGDILNPGGTTGDILDDVGDVTEDITDIFGGGFDFSWDDFMDEGSDQMGGDWGMDETLGGFDFGSDFPTWDYQQDLDNLGDLGQGFNEDVTDLTGGFQDDAENWWDENTDSLNDLESGINTTLGDAVDLGELGIENLARGGAGLEATAGLLGEGVTWATGATLDINNPNSLISSPQNWYEEWGIVSEWDLTGGDPDPLGLMDYNMSILGTVINETYRPDLWGPFGDDGGGGGSAQTGSGSTLGQTSFEGLQGDPFGREGKERREIHMQRKFPQQVATAPSLVNQRQKKLG